MATRTNSIAAAMLIAGIEVGHRVAVLQEPTIGWICSILAIMRIGAVYVPLDLSTMLARLAVIASDCQPSVVLIDENTERHITKLRAYNLKTINITDVSPAESALSIAAKSEGSAMILYTSGSSGVPKGVVLKHEGLRNWIEPSAQMYNLGSEVVFQQSSSSFDMSFTQIFTALFFGGSMYLLPRCMRGDALAISEIIAHGGITFTCATPSEYFNWIKYGQQDLLRKSSWKTALCAGEPVVHALIQQLKTLEKYDLRFFNSYGPTEISLVATAMELSYVRPNTGPDSVAAGFVLPNYSVYVVDEHMRLVPPGVQGELYVGGAGIAAGYLNNTYLTNEKFVVDIFATPEYQSKGWTSMHRTGDLGRWRADGTILIEGRISGDTQVKLRGLRIDLKDIESAIIQTAKGILSEAVVSIRRTLPQDPEFLVAHVVFDPGSTNTERERCQTSLSSNLQLPQFMVPAAIVPLSRMPMTNSFKIDRQAIAALPLPKVAQEQKNLIELTSTESQLKAIWRRSSLQKLPSIIVSHVRQTFSMLGARPFCCCTYKGVLRTVSTSLSRWFRCLNRVPWVQWHCGLRTSKML